MREKLENLRIAKYRFVLRPSEFIKLSSYAGSSLRKEFTPIFKQITCLEPHGDCKSCEVKTDCPYFITIENGEGIQNPDYKRYQTPPKPFIFEPPLKRKTFYSHNEELVFDLILIGRALEYFPFFAASLRRLGEMGIGRNQGKYSLQKILAFDFLKNEVAGEFVFDSKDQAYDKDISVSVASLYEKFDQEFENIQEVTVSVFTPLRMKRLGTENWHLHFRVLARNILTRLANLAFAYCGYTEFLHFPEILYEAGSVRTVKENFTWEDWRHPVLRNKNPSLRLGGFLGDIIYKGDITDFWPILRLGEIIHIGKNTSFGLGRMIIDNKIIEPSQAQSPEQK